MTELSGAVRRAVLFASVLALTSAGFTTPIDAHESTPPSVQEAAERLLAASPGAVGGRADREAASSLWAGQLPPDLPVAVPLPPGARMLGSVGYEVERESWTLTVIDVPLDQRSALQFYTDAFGAQGWEIHPPSPIFELRGGFTNPLFPATGPVSAEGRVRAVGWVSYCQPDGAG